MGLGFFKHIRVSKKDLTAEGMNEVLREGRSRKLFLLVNRAA